MRVFLVEDSAAVCERLAEMIEASGNHDVVGQAGTYDEAIAGITATQPDVGIFDIKLGSGNGIDVLAQVRKTMPELVGIVMSNYVTPQHAKASAAAGAQYFLDKSADFERITEILATLQRRGNGHDHGPNGESQP
jgi:DNA-binding NarL/FixJ family response regulator